ncbi:MAG: type II and III secretion system protein family protein [Rhodocyclaceae bacterium]|nr:type II and III secretion system protein family protein [Rhodocyclaceae bacterium]
MRQTLLWCMAAAMLVVVGGPAQAALADPHRVNTVVGRAEVMDFSTPVSRIAVGDPRVLDYVMLSPTQIYVLGKSVGSTNLLIWGQRGAPRSVSVSVDIDLEPLRQALGSALPGQAIDVTSVSGSVVLGGTVSDVLVANQAVEYGEAFVRSLNRQLLLVLRSGDGTTPVGTQSGTATAAINSQMVAVQVINRMRVRDPQQVMLEVRVAEISKTLLDKLGAQVSARGKIGDVRWSILSGFLAGGALGQPLAAGSLSLSGLDIDAEKRNGLIKILAEPTIVAVSGHEGSFLAGGVIFLPTPAALGQAPGLQEYPFGISLKFIPTVLDNGRISLKVAPEVSEVSTEGVSYSVGNATLILPRVNKRNVSTTVQLRDGQSLVIGGLLRNDVTQSVKRLPLLGDLPVLGPLFRSSQFIAEKSELVVIVSPSLVKPTEAPPPLPTDHYTPPTPKEFFLDGKLEGGAAAGNKAAEPDKATGGTTGGAR